MTSTLYIRKTPKAATEWHFKMPIKGIIARQFFDHDGSLGGSMITIGPEYLSWFEGVLAAVNLEAIDRLDLVAAVDVLRDGGTIDMWLEV